MISRNSERIFQMQKLLTSTRNKQIWVVVWKKVSNFLQSWTPIFFSWKPIWVWFSSTFVANKIFSWNHDSRRRCRWWSYEPSLSELTGWWVEVLGRCRCFCQPSHGSILEQEKWWGESRPKGVHASDRNYSWSVGWEITYLQNVSNLLIKGWTNPLILSTYHGHPSRAKSWLFGFA